MGQSGNLRRTNSEYATIQAVPMRICAVSFADVRGIRHTVDVQAESLFEAAILGVRTFRGAPWIEHVGPATVLDIEVREPCDRPPSRRAVGACARKAMAGSTRKVTPRVCALGAGRTTKEIVHRRHRAGKLLFKGSERRQPRLGDDGLSVQCFLSSVKVTRGATFSMGITEILRN
jgi:hypothetical protein